MLFCPVSRTIHFGSFRQLNLYTLTLTSIGRKIWQSQLRAKRCLGLAGLNYREPRRREYTNLNSLSQKGFTTNKTQQQLSMIPDKDLRQPLQDLFVTGAACAADHVNE